MPAEQLTLPGIHIRDDATFSNFFHKSEQGNFIRIFKELARGEGEPFTYLWGAPGSGKSHLLQAVCHEVRQTKHSYMYVSFKKIAHLSPAMLQNLAHLWLLCLDDLDALQYVPHREEWEENLFYLYNSLLQAGGRLLVSASMAPAGLPIKLLDLKSRLHMGLTIRVEALNDDEKKRALQERAAQRGMEMSEECVDYLLNHYSRSMVNLFEILDQLDDLSLKNHRKVTVPFIRECFKT